MLPDRYKIKPLVWKFANDCLEHIGDALAIFLRARFRGHRDRRIGVASVSSRLKLQNKCRNDSRIGVLPDTRGRRGKQGRLIKKFNFNTAVQIRSIDQHRHQLVSSEGLHDLEKSKFVRADRDCFDAELSAILLAPDIELGRRLFQSYDTDRETSRGQSHTAEFPGTEMASEQKSSFPAVSATLEKFESATFYDELVQSGYAASRGIAKVMQHLQKIDEASAAKFLLGRLISSQYGQIAHESFPPLATKLIAQMPH